MRIATWNVNSLKARLDAVQKWLARAEPDVLLMQETKVADDDVPEMPFRMAGYEIAHHGEGRWNGVAIASKQPITDVIANFGDGPVRDSSAGATNAAEDDFDPFDEARMVSGVTFDIRFTSVYAPNGRVVDSRFYEGKLRWFDRVERWIRETQDPAQPFVIGGDVNVTPTPDDVWDEVKAHGGTHVSPQEREKLANLRALGLTDLYRMRQDGGGLFSWWDYRAGMFHRNEGMRIDVLYGTEPVAKRVVWAEIDREARKGPPTPSDHAPVVVDLSEPGNPFEAGWDGALRRIAARTKPQPHRSPAQVRYEEEREAKRR